MPQSIESLRAEYVAHGLTEALYRLIKVAVAASVWGLRVPSWRAPDGRWDADAIGAVADEFIVEELPPDRLRYLLDIAGSAKQFLSDVEQRARDYLRRHAVRGPVANLREQLIRILEGAPEFIVLSERGRRPQWVWGLTEWAAKVPVDGDAGRARDTVSVLRSAPRPRYNPDATKRPPALRSDDLRLFLRRLFSVTRSPWMLQDIVNLVAEALGLREQENTAPLGEETGRSVAGPDGGDGLDPSERAEIRAVAGKFYRACSPAEHRILQALAKGAGTFHEVAEHADVVPVTAWRRSRALVKRLSDLFGDAALAQEVWDEIMIIARTSKFLEEGLP